MIRLAELAGIAPETALLDLSAWRAEGRPRAVYQSIAERLAKTAAALVLLVGVASGPALAAGTEAVQGNPESGQTVYYDKFHIKFRFQDVTAVS